MSTSQQANGSTSQQVFGEGVSDKSDESDRSDKSDKSDGSDGRTPYLITKRRWYRLNFFNFLTP